MVTALDILKKLENIDIPTMVQIAMEETASAAANAQRHQLSQGLNKFDKPITNLITGSRNYSPSYAKIKGKKRPIDLHRLGDYYAGIGMDVHGDTFIMFSADRKAEKLEKTYDPLGLGKTARAKYLESLKPKLLYFIKLYLR